MTLPTTTPITGDDEALWFPVHMHTGDSFGPTRDAPGDLGDGIGLPGRSARPGGKPPKKPGISATSWLWLTLWGVAAAGIVVTAARKDIASVMTENWLKGQGVHARLKFDKLSLDHLSGHIVIGDPAHPEVSIDNFDADYSLNFFHAGWPLARLTRLHVVHPDVTVALKGGKLSFGSLDKLINDSLNAPPSDAPPPSSVVVEDARITLLSDYGTLHGRGGLSLTDGKLSYLTVAMPAARLSGPLGQGDFGGGTLTARTVRTAGRGDQLSVQANLAGDHVSLLAAHPAEDADAGKPTFEAQGVAVDIDARLPYRNSKAFLDAFDGATETTLAIKAAGLETADARFDHVEGNLHIDGDLNLGGKTPGFDGKARLLARTDGVTSGDIDGHDLHLQGQELKLKASLSGASLGLHVEGPASADIGSLKQGGLVAQAAHVNLSSLTVDSAAEGLNAAFQGQLTAGHLATGDISLDSTTAALTGQAHSDPVSGQWGVTFSSDLKSDNGRYAGLAAMAKSQAEAQAEWAKTPPAPGAPARTPPGPDAIVAMDRALSRFSLRANGIGVTIASAAGAPPQIDIRLKGAATAGLNGGGTATLTPVSSQPLLSSRQAGGFSLDIKGAGLPKLSLDVSSFGLDNSGNLGGAYKLTAQGNVFPVAEAAVSAHGRFMSNAKGVLSVTMDGPTAFTAKSAEIGDHLENIAGTLTQTGPSLLMSGPDGWTVNGAFHAVSLSAPGEVVAVAGGEGTFSAFSLPGSDVTGLKANVAAATVSDAMPAGQTRFNPLSLNGTLAQDARAMTGRFTALLPQSAKPVPIADIHLDSDPRTGKGAIEVDTRDYLTFAPHALQPIELTPTVAAILSRDVSGKATFKGGFSWDKSAASSSGTLTLDGLSFTGATGVSQGLNGQIVFTSLSPLLSDPHQHISIASMSVGVPLHDLDMRFQFLGDHMAVEQAEVQTPGGPVLLQPMTVPFDGKSAISGTVTFDGLDFGKIVAATSLADSMSFQGTVSGKLPFVVANGGISFIQGFMASDASGQISIRRTAVTDMKATGSVSSPDTAQTAAGAPAAFNPFEDLAYQAMEYLAYDRIDAKINSLPTGAIDLNFHIKGHFAPPQTQKAKISLYDYISGKWMQKPINLPSGTPVELYLDVPLNLNDAFAGFGITAPSAK